MCGICGTGGLIDKKAIRLMCDSITHRGPDDDGFYLDGDVMLAMRRLKVIDLETGSQPIFNEDKTVVVVYNGEIYNYRELRVGLQKKGHILKTSSDTETIVHLYEEYGNEFVNRLRGMFAFALWDARKKRLVLARDRIGIKPLYYYYKKGKIVFASEIKSLLKCHEVIKDIDYAALHDYLTFTYVPAPKTIFKNVYKLMPGHMLVYEKNSLLVNEYWNLNETGLELGIDSDWNERSCLERLLELLKESISGHLISDVPLGVFLSGGTDSGSMVALASELSGAPVKTFCIGFDDNYYNEQRNARLVAERYHTDHHEFIVKPPGKDKIEEIIGFFDEPFADSSAIPTYFVSKCARELVTVALSGDGGDEIFGGYGNYKADKLVNYLRYVPNALRKVGQAMLEKAPGRADDLAFNQQARKLLITAGYPASKGHVSWLNVFSHDNKEKLYVNDELRAQLVRDSCESYNHYFENFREEDFINACMKVDMKTVLPDDYLTKVDRMSMANSLEVRVPYLDHKLLEFSADMPSCLKLRGFATKYLLKKMMKNRLPEAILNGKKKGFSIPLNKWFREDFSTMVEIYLSKQSIKKRGYFSSDYIERLSKEHLNGKRDWSKFLWTLICFEIWHRMYFD